MARAKGTVKYGLNLEVQTPAPLDARSLVATKADLTLSETWVVAPSTQAYTYTGMLVAVASDATTSNNGIYMLKSRTGWADPEQWLKLSNETVFSITGLNITGLYNETPDHVYMKADVVSVNGSLYYCLVDNTTNIKPSVTTDWQNNWSLFQLKGSQGNDGATPTIGNNGNWFINGVDQLKKAIGENGITPNIQDGYWYIGTAKQGKATGTSITISNDGYWVLDGIKSTTLALGLQGQSAIANINYLGAYKPNTQYYKSDRNGKTDVVIGSDGTMYAALVDSKNIDPVSDTLHNTWVVFSMKGNEGKPGDTPYIKDGYWWIGAERKDVKAAGDVLSISSDGFWQINGVTTDKKAVPENGQNGTNGTNGSNGENAVANINVRGPWQTGQTYLHLNVDGTTDVVLGSDGTSYFCLQDTSIDPTTDTTHTYWAQFSMAGSPGLTPHIELDPDGEYRWYIGTQNQNIVAQGKNGQNGINGRNASQPYITEQGFWGYKLLLSDGTYQYNTTSIQAEGLTPYIKEGFWWIGNRNTGVQAIGQSAIANLNYLGAWTPGITYYNKNATANNWTDVVLGADDNSYYCKANNTDKNPCKLVDNVWVRDEANAQYWAKFVMKGTANDGRNIELRRYEGWLEWRVVGEANDQWKQLIELKTLVSQELSDISTPIGSVIMYAGASNQIPTGYLLADGRTIHKASGSRSYIVNQYESYANGFHKYRLFGDGFSYNSAYQPQIGDKIDYDGKIAYVQAIYPTGGYYVVGLSVNDLTINSSISIQNQLIYPELVEKLSGGNTAQSATLPDLRNRFIVGYNPNDTDYNTIGKTGGSKTVQLTDKQSGLPLHTHGVKFTIGEGSDANWYKATVNGNKTQTLRGPIPTTEAGGVGAEQPHENRPPYYVLAYLIKASYIGEIKTPYDTYKQTLSPGITPMTPEEWLETMRGETGVAGFNYRYDYVNESIYNENDVVRSLVDGNAYYCKVDGTTLKEPSANPTEWTIFVMRGAQGASAPQVLIRYSTSSSTSEGSDWHATPTLSDVYARFSTDNGANYGSPIKFKGETGASAYPIKIQYSTTGLAGSWSETASATSKYLQFSTDDGTTWSSTISISGGSSVFTQDIQVNLPSGRYFGKYAYNALIQSNGKTFEEVLRDIAIESIAPTASVSASGSLPYNDAGTVDRNITVNMSASSNNSGGTITERKLYYRRVGDATWIELKNQPGNSDITAGQTTYTHNVKDLLAVNNVKGFEYKLYAKDSIGATKEATSNAVTPNGYSAPTYSLTAFADTKEKGDVAKSFTGTISQTAQNGVRVLSYEIQYKMDGGAWTRLTLVNYATATTMPIVLSGVDNSTIVNTIKNASSVQYQLLVTCTSATINQTATIGLGTTTLNYYRYFGAVATLPSGADSTARRTAVISNNPTLQAIQAGTFVMTTGNTQKNFFVCLPPGLQLLSALDTTANATVSFSAAQDYVMKDAGGNDRTHKMYTVTLGQAFSSSHNWTITIGVV